MTAESPTDVALRYVGQAVETLRATMHDEMAAVRTDLTTLSIEFRTHIAAQTSRLAVLEHRTAELEKDVSALQGQREDERAERDRERAADRRLRTQIAWTAAISVLCALIAVVVALTGR